MGVVDLLDASMHHYNFNRKSCTWYYGLHLIHIIHRNSCIVYRHPGGNVTYLGYTIENCRLLDISRWCTRQCTWRSSSFNSGASKSSARSLSIKNYHTCRKSIIFQKMSSLLFGSPSTVLGTVRFA